MLAPDPSGGRAILEPLRRAGQEKTGGIPGTGVGLTIRELPAELMGGKVGFQSVQGQRCEFLVELPAHAALESGLVSAAVLP